MLQLSAEDFQSWKQFGIDIDKLTVVVGASNLGKSAMYRALKGALRNDIPAAYVRRNSKATEVTLQHAGHTITAKRTAKGATTYVVDEQEFAKLGGDVPQVIKDLNFGEIEIGKVKLDPIFARQADRQFMLEEPPATINAIIGAFSSTERLEQGKKLGKTRIAEKNAEGKVLAEQSQANSVLLDAINPMVDAAEGIIAEIMATEAQSAETETEIATETALLHHMGVLIRNRQLQSNLPLVPTDRIGTTLEVVEALTALLKHKASHDRTLTVLNSMPEIKLASVQSAVEAVSATGTLIKATGRLTALRSALADTEDNTSILGEAKVAYQEAKALHVIYLLKKKAEERLSRIPEAEGLEAVTKFLFKADAEVALIAALRALLDAEEKYNTVASNLAGVKAAVAEGEAAITKLRNEQAEYEAEQRKTTCPSCGTRF